LVSSFEQSSQHLRILSHLADMIDTHQFKQRWTNARNESELQEILLRNERFINISVAENNRTRKLIDRQIQDIPLPGESLIAILKRDTEITIPNAQTFIREDDEPCMIAEPEDILTINTWADNGKPLSLNKSAILKLI